MQTKGALKYHLIGLNHKVYISIIEMVGQNTYLVMLTIKKPCPKSLCDYLGSEVRSVLIINHNIRR